MNVKKILPVTILLSFLVGCSRNTPTSNRAGESGGVTSKKSYRTDQAEIRSRFAANLLMTGDWEMRFWRAEPLSHAFEMTGHKHLWYVWFVPSLVSGGITLDQPAGLGVKPSARAEIKNGKLNWTINPRGDDAQNVERLGQLILDAIMDATLYR